MTVGIVGAGISGLALAHHLDRVGVEYVVLDAAADPGGVMRTREVDGRALDLGPQRTRLTPGVRELVDAAGLTGRLRRAADRPLYVYHDGALRRVPLSPRTALTTDLLSPLGKLRALCEPLTAPPRDDETVGGFLRRAFGREVAERVAGPLYAGLYGSHPDEMPVRHSFGKAMATLGADRSLLATALRRRLRGASAPPVVSFEDGMGELPAALADRYADRVRLGTPVESVEQVGTGYGDVDGDRDARVAADGGSEGRDGDGRYRLRTPDGATVVDDVVLTTPAPVAADLLADVAPAASRSLSALTYSPLAVVHVVADGGLDAAGYQVGFDAPFDTLGVTSNHGLFGRHGLHTCYLGGLRNPGCLDRPDERLGERAAAEFAAVTGLDAEPVAVHRVEPGMPAYDRSWDALEGLALPDGVHLCANFAARAGVPGRIREARALAEELAA